MYELIPIGAGVAAALAESGFAGRSARTALIATVSVLAGLAAASASGELERSWLFLVWDVTQAALAAVLTLAALRAVASRARL